MLRNVGRSNTSASGRKYLLSICAAGRECAAELFGEGREFDVAYNDYTGRDEVPELADWVTSEDTWAYQLVAKYYSDLIPRYEAVAFFNDDIEVSTTDINRLFRIGTGMRMDLWHPALTLDSPCPWPHLYVRDTTYCRPTNCVELMAPFFSRDAFEKCKDTFALTRSGWGLDAVWATRLKNVYVIDAVPVRHTRPLSSGSRVFPNGMTPNQEAAMVFAKFGLDPNRAIF